MTTEDLIGIILSLAYIPSDPRAIAAIGAQVAEFKLNSRERRYIGNELRTWCQWQGPGALTGLVGRMRDEATRTGSTPGWAPPKCSRCQDSGFEQIDAERWICRRCACQVTKETTT
jgi:hypothetical protein